MVDQPRLIKNRIGMCNLNRIVCKVTKEKSNGWTCINRDNILLPSFPKSV